MSVLNLGIYLNRYQTGLIAAPTDLLSASPAMNLISAGRVQTKALPTKKESADLAVQFDVCG
jgi:hypothetical protein